MKTGKMIAWIGLLAMTAGLANGFINGDFLADGGETVGKPVGRHVPDRSIRGICSVFHVDRLTFFLGHRKEDYNRN